ncbi:tyrosine-type recombinase/integrase [Streptosporangium vulgare]|uniref:Tyrosine-type recombinase/integrase n=1 Tax=Streptosporangium vulgare TaxID=46190 RepID=A0ABV5TUQ9_9ACTN
MANGQSVLKASYTKRCGCKDPKTGKPLNSNCPDLTKRKHGTHGWRTRIDTTTQPNRQLRRFGYDTKVAAQQAFDHVADLLKLARDDERMRQRIGDLIFESKHGQDFPDVETIRRKLRMGIDLAASEGTVGELLEDWYAGKRAKKESSRRSWRQHLDHYLLPQVGVIPRSLLRATHIDGLFDTIEEWNAEITTAKAEGRPPHLPGDLRQRHKVVGLRTQHHILQTLSSAYNWGVRRRLIEFNPCLGVELPPAERDPARVWSPEQVMQFLTASAHDPLGLLYRLALLRGLRRGEACGLRWSDLDLETGHAQIEQTILQLGDRIIIDTPKTRAGRRTVSFDTETRLLLAARYAEYRRARLAAPEGYEDHGLVFARDNGRPLSPERVTEGFKRLAREVGLPVIKLHEARHTAATLGLEAGLDIKVVSAQLGHTRTRITQDLYTHVRPAVLDDGAERVLTLVQGSSAEAKKA